MLRWASDYAELHKLVVREGGALAAAGPPLVKYLELLRTSPKILDKETSNAFKSQYLEHIFALDAAGIPFLPKHHLWGHLTWEMEYKGNARYYSTFLDETLNAAISLVASHSHPAHWEERIYQRLALLGKLRADGHWAG